jgi:hypothetical protein
MVEEIFNHFLINGKSRWITLEKEFIGESIINSIYGINN